MDSTQFEIRFQSLYQEGRALSFPCDPRGDVDLASLSPQAVENYYFAWSHIGQEYANPVVQTQALAPQKPSSAPVWSPWL